MDNIHQNGGFKSSTGFILACIGSAVGMGTIWMFPYRLGEYGGGAFLIPYILFLSYLDLLVYPLNLPLVAVLKQVH